MINEDKRDPTHPRPDKKEIIKEGVRSNKERFSLPDFEYTPKKPPIPPPAAQDSTPNQGSNENS